MDIFQKASEFTEAKEAQEAGLYPYFIPLTSNEGSEAIYHGKRIIMCGSNNYLGLTTHPKVREAAVEATAEFGTSCTGSRFLNGTLEMHLELEEELAKWVGKEAALAFTTGMQVNLGTISAIVDRHDVVVMDKYNHASLLDGARLSYGDMKRFRHNDAENLDRVLSRIPEDRGVLVVVDGLFSMEGDLAPLPEIVPVCKKYGARLMVDDAHAMGVIGGGRGTAAHFDVTEDVDLIMSTFSKSFASVGGFIAGSEEVIHYIKHHARSLIFSASLPPGNTAAALTALKIMREEPERIERVNKNAEKMRQGFQELGFDTGESVTPIIPIIIGDDTRTFLAWKMLLENGVFVNPVISPATPPGRQLLRTSYMATHTDEQLNTVLGIFEKVGKALDII
jgi:8-amino-7-oxononanoate synthase